MKIQTFSIVVGGSACNARCPYCCSRMTGDCGVQLGTTEFPPHYWRRFDVACRLAMQCGATTAMLTGKGEPTLWPEHITQHLEKLQQRFPLIELQTNGLELVRGRVDVPMLRGWALQGLTTIAISVVHYLAEENAKIYTPGREYPSLPGLVETLHEEGFSVRLCCTMFEGGIYTNAGVGEMILFAKDLNVEQLTLMPVSQPYHTASKAGDPTTEWVAQHELSSEQLRELRYFVACRAKRILTLPHGAEVYADLSGQNVCLSNCLDRDETNTEDMRNLILFPDGHIRHQWTPGAVVL